MPKEKTSKKVASKSGKGLHDSALIKELLRRIQRDCSTVMKYVDDAESAFGSSLTQREKE